MNVIVGLLNLEIEHYGRMQAGEGFRGKLWLYLLKGGMENWKWD
jgi:hypothetical protein